jgi:acyl-CoA synthetase (AMP-forming)/AMP-acid ligase II
MITCEQPTPVTVSAPSTLTELLRYRAAQQPHRRAYTFLRDGETDEVHLTYGELDRQARSIGAQLQHLGAAGRRVLLLYPAGLEYIAAFFGCLYAGAIAVPAYPPRLNRSIERLQAIVDDAQATVALTTTPMLSKLATEAEQSAHLTGLQWVNTDQLEAHLAEDWQEPVVESEALAFLQYTSGSTGTPKGVMLSHGNLLANLRMIQQSFRNTPDSIGVSWLPLYHDMGLIGCLLQPLYVGFPCILMSPMAFLQRPVRWLQAISRYQATGSGAPNFAYDLCARKVTPAQRATLDLSRWELAFSGAEPVRQATLERFATAFAACGFRREAFHPCYGLAEASLIVAGSHTTRLPVSRTVQKQALEQHRVVATSAGDAQGQTFIGCGQSLGSQQIAIVDPITRTRCAPGTVGEIWIAGANVAQGYWQRPEETTRTFHASLAETEEGPFMRTGDLGFLDGEELFITGRLKDVIIIRGSNHYPQDIELTVEQSHPSLRPGCGAVFAVEVDGEERLVVVQEVERRYQPTQPRRPERRQVAIDPGCDPEHPQPVCLDTVVGQIRQAIAEQHGLQAHAVVLLRAGSIPKTSSGKMQRYACRAGFLAHTLDAIALSSAASPILHTRAA